MKFVRYADMGGSIALGVVRGDEVFRIPDTTDLLDLLGDDGDSLRSAGKRALASSTEVAPIDGITPLSPIRTPPTVRDFYAFERHVKAGREWRGLDMDPLWYRLPAFYFSNPYAVTGAGDIAIPPGCTQFDFELEVAAIVGRNGTNLTPDEGEDRVIGYCVMNDWSARDIQHEEMRLSMGPVKGKDSATGLGPLFVTKDELADARTATGYDLTMTCRVNGVEYSRANWSDVYWSFGEMLSYASRGTDVRVGDVVGSGTCGTGCILELSRTVGGDRFPWLKAGDEVVAEVEGLGLLANVVIPSTHELLDLRSGETARV